MMINKDGTPITSLLEWERLAGPKRSDQWRAGRSACELARAWVGSGAPAMPTEIRSLLDSRPETRGITVDVVFPELRIPFDSRAGEPRNADLAFLGQAGSHTAAVTVEAKADEPFGATLAETLCDALERSLTNERSHGVERVRDLVQALLQPHVKGAPRVGDLRYQLLTAAAGTIAYAIANGASCAVLIVHEFVTNLTKEHLQAQHAEDYRRFVRRLGGGTPEGIAGVRVPRRGGNSVRRSE